MIKASELRQKYFNEESFNNSLFEQLKSLCEKSIIAAAEKGEDSVSVNIPLMYKKRIAEWLEDNEYTALGVNDTLDEIQIYWSKDLVEQMIDR
jgi:hypothetical protein